MGELSRLDAGNRDFMAMLTNSTIDLQNFKIVDEGCLNPQDYLNRSNADLDCAIAYVWLNSCEMARHHELQFHDCDPFPLSATFQEMVNLPRYLYASKQKDITTHFRTGTKNRVGTDRAAFLLEREVLDTKDTYSSESDTDPYTSGAPNAVASKEPEDKNKTATSNVYIRVVRIMRGYGLTAERTLVTLRRECDDPGGKPLIKLGVIDNVTIFECLKFAERYKPGLALVRRAKTDLNPSYPLESTILDIRRKQKTSPGTEIVLRLPVPAGEQQSDSESE